MKTLLTILAIGLAGLSVSCQQSTHPKGAANIPVFSHHYRGSVFLAQNTNSAKLKAIWALPATAPFRDDILGKLARAPYGADGKPLPAASGDQASLLRPLLEDLLVAESVSHISGPTNQFDFALAIKLSPERAALWQTNLWQFASAPPRASPRAVKIDRFDGWESARLSGSNVLQVIRVEDWLVIGHGLPPLQGAAQFLSRIAAKKPLRDTEPDSWLSFEADLPRWGVWSSFLARHPLAPVRLDLSLQGENIRARGSFSLPEKMAWTPEPWLVPTNAMDESLVSFTAARGISAYLDRLFPSSKIGLDKWPNQFSSWGLPTAPSQAFVAAPVQDSTNAIRKMATVVPQFVQAALGTNSRISGQFLYASNTPALRWQGFPVIVPFVQPLRQADHNFLLMGLFPLPGRSNQPPPELFQQLSGNQHLAYYDWEITESRIHFARQLYRLGELMNRQQTTPELAPTQVWIREVASLLGNTITQITVTDPQRLDVVRKSHLGLTGFELVTLIQWIESPKFPLSFEPKPPMTRPNKAPAPQDPASPAPPPPASAVPSPPAAKPAP